MDDIENAYSAYLQQQSLYNQEWANYIQNWNNWYWQNILAQQYAAANAAYDYADYAEYADYADSDDKEQDVDAAAGGGDEQNFGISESDIMQKAENEAKKHVIERMEKRMESRLEKEMMSK